MKITSEFLISERASLVQQRDEAYSLYRQTEGAIAVYNSLLAKLVADEPTEVEKAK